MPQRFAGNDLANYAKGKLSVGTGKSLCGSAKRS
jgi:hypothetical protein